MSERDELRARLLGLLRHRTILRYALPIRRRYIHPDDWRNMINPLRTRRDYSSAGRRIPLVDALFPTDES